MVSDNVMSAPDTVATFVESLVRYGSDQKTFWVIYLTEVMPDYGGCELSHSYWNTYLRTTASAAYLTYEIAQ